MVAVLLDIVAHPIFRSHQRAGIARAGEARVAARFLQRRVEAGDRIGDRRRIMGKVGQLVARDSKVAKQGVGENLGKLVRAGVGAAARREVADVDFICFGQLEQQSRGDRALIALEMIEIAGADPERRGHRGLRQGAVAAEPANPGAKEKLRGGHPQHLSTLYRILKSICDLSTLFAEPKGLPRCSLKADQKWRQVDDRI
jgi:hypothetical protein